MEESCDLAAVCEGNLHPRPAEACASRRDHSGKLSERGAVACWGIDINYKNAASTSPIFLCNQEPAVTRLMSCSLVPLVPTGKNRSDRGMCLRSVWGHGSKGPLKGSPDQSRHPEANNCGIKIKISLSLDFISFIFPLVLFLAPSLYSSFTSFLLLN